MSTRRWIQRGFAVDSLDPMTLPALLVLSRRPAALVLRLLLWPTAIVLLGNLAGATEDDGLAGGLLTFAVVAVLSFLAPLADGLVLRLRSLVLVWSITTVAITMLLSLQPVVDFLLHGPEGTTTWTETVRFALDDLPSTLVFFLVLVGLPVGLGAVTGYALQRAFRPRAGQLERSSALNVPRT